MYKKEYCRAHLISDSGLKFTQVYFLVTTRQPILPGCYVDCYGVAIVCPESKSEKIVPNITLSRDKMERFITLLCRCGVTEITLSDVIEDALGVTI